MIDTYEDHEERVLHGVPFRATTAQYRKALLAWTGSPEYAAWSALDSRAKYGDFDATSLDGAELCRSLTACEVRLAARTHQIVDDMLAGE